MTNPVNIPSVYCLLAVPLLLDSKQNFFISHKICPTDLFHPSPALHLKSFQVFSDLLPDASKLAENNKEKLFNHNAITIIMSTCVTAYLKAHAILFGLLDPLNLTDRLTRKVRYLFTDLRCITSRKEPRSPLRGGKTLYRPDMWR